MLLLDLPTRKLLYLAFRVVFRFEKIPSTDLHLSSFLTKLRTLSKEDNTIPLIKLLNRGELELGKVAHVQLELLKIQEI